MVAALSTGSSEDTSSPKDLRGAGSASAPCLKTGTAVCGWFNLDPSHSVKDSMTKAKQAATGLEVKATTLLTVCSNSVG